MANSSAPQIIQTIPAVDFYSVKLGERTFITRAPLAVLKENSTYFLQVADVRWRIGTNLAALKCAPNTYIFAVQGQADLFYSIIVLPDTPASMYNQFHDFIAGSTSFQDSTLQPQQQPQSSGGAQQTSAAPKEPCAATLVMAGGIVKAGQLMGMGLLAAAELTAKGLEKGAEIAVTRTPPASDPQASRARLQQAASVTKTVAGGAQVAVGTVMSVAGAAARMMAQRLEKTDMARKIGSNSDVQLLSSAAGQAAKDIGSALQTAAHIIGESGKAAGSSFMQQRYGTPGTQQPGTSASSSGQAQQPPTTAGECPPHTQPCNAPPATSYPAPPAPYPNLPSGMVMGVPLQPPAQQPAPPPQ